MKEKLKKLCGSKKLIAILLVAIILLQEIYVSYVFAFQKEGYHSDEMYSYGLSNSHENPFLVLEGSIYDDYALNENVDNWISGSTLKDYLVVNDGEAFDYANVWYNQSLDRHPPLYYTVLHTICSFFPNQFSPWFGFSINIVCFAVIQIFLFFMARKLLKSNWLALLICICFGFSTGAVNMTIYIRMYAMTAMWAIIIAYLHTRLLDKDKLKLRSLIPFIVITMLGALTQHEFTIVAFIFAVCFCIRFLCKKQIKNFFKYGTSMALGVLLAWAVFPPLMGQIFEESSDSGVDFELFIRQVSSAFEKFANSLFGLHNIIESDIIFWSMVLPALVIVAVLFLIPICFLLRKSSKFISLKERIKAKLSNFLKAIKSFRPVKFLNALKRIGNINFMYLPLLLSFSAIAIIASKSIPLFRMVYYDRYLFAVYPFYMLVFVGVVICVLSKLFKKPYALKTISSVLFILLLFNNVKNVKPSYLFQSEGIGNLTELTADSECIIVELNRDSEWRLVCFSSDMMEADNVFYTSLEELEDCKDKLNSMETDKPVYLFMYYMYNDIDGDNISFYFSEDEQAVSEDEMFEKHFNDLSFCKEYERIGSITNFSCNYMVYRLQ